jgi:ABC transporter DrrB family efflux protein
MSARTIDGHISPLAAVRHATILMGRNLRHIRSDPEQIIGMTVQPIMFLVLFVYIFGGAIAGSSREYLQFVLAGILIQSLAFNGFQTALGLNVDFQRGVIDRFRSLPISRSSVIAGRVMADTIRMMWAIFIITGFAMIMGFRFEGGLAGAIGSMVLATLFGIMVCWPMAYLGITAKSPESVNTWGFMIILPLTFASTIFVPADTMPSWIQGFVRANPISKVTDAMRALMLGGPVQETLWPALAWIVGIIAVFAPLAVMRYRRRA